MKMLLPPPESRARILAALRAFYATEKRSWLRQALSEWAAFHEVKQPRVELRQRLRRCPDGTQQLGITFSDGRVLLWTPSSWKSQPPSRFPWTEALYIETVLHELAHVLFYVEDERKADLYAKRFVKGAA